MKGNQIAALKRYIRAHVDNQIELSFIGAQNPDDFELIEYNAEMAEKELMKYIETLRDIKKPSEEG